MTQENNTTSPRITYQNLFWLFILGSLIGVPMEGLWCLIRFNHWETHVVSVWGPFCIIYGFGAVGFYLFSFLIKKHHLNMFVQFLMFAFVGSFIEFVCSWVLQHRLDMEAWDYSKQFLNIQGRISLQMTFLWGALGLFFMNFLLAPAEKLLKKMQGTGWKALCVCLSVFLAVDFSLTAVCITRWADRHAGKSPVNHAEEMIDSTYDDDFMQKRFCEWHFIQ